MFLISVLLVVVVGFGLLSCATSATQTDTGGGAYMGRVEAVGKLMVWMSGKRATK